MGQPGPIQDNPGQSDMRIRKMWELQEGLNHQEMWWIQLSYIAQ